MKSLIKAMFAALLVLCMALCVLPVSAQMSFEAQKSAQKSEVGMFTVPAGYNAHDYTKCVEFLEQTDENNVKNGEKISQTYDVNDPATWGEQPFQWAERDGELRVVNISLWLFNELVGSLDVSDCAYLVSLDFMKNEISELNVSGCTSLLYLDCSENRLTGGLDVTDCAELIYLYCDNNELTELIVSHLASLEELDCFNNGLTELDVSGCPMLQVLYCTGNELSEIDLSGNPKLGYDLINAQGKGCIGYRFLTDSGEIHARPLNGASFDGFYDENGSLIDEGFFSDEDEAYVYYFGGVEIGTVTARFSGGASHLAGDIDGNGSVTVSDAVTALRLAMQLIDSSGLNTDNADMDGNGIIAISDAVVILRLAMGLM